MVHSDSPGQNVWLARGRKTGGRKRETANKRTIAQKEIVRRAAAIYTLIETAKLNDIDPQAWLAGVLAHINDHRHPQAGRALAVNWVAEMERRTMAA